MGDVRTYTHPEDAQPSRADKAVSVYFANEFSRSRLEESFKDGKVKIDGQPIPKKHEVRAGDVIEIELPEIIETEVKPVDIPIDVLFEDEDIIVVNKPSGMTVHPGSGTGDDTLVHAMLHHTDGNLSSAGGAERPGIVHRLDKETSGAMVLAKNDSAYYKLVELFSEREVVKVYLALICGVPTVRSGSIRKPIGRHPSFKTRMCVSDPENGRDARTDWFVEEKFGNAAALLSCRIFTGRTHQIRVHMTDLGFPILGDYTYAFQKNKLKLIEAPKRVMLHSHKLEFPHPTKEGEIVSVVAPPPKDFSDLILQLKEFYF